MFSFKELLKTKKTEISYFKKENISLLSDQSSQFLNKAIYGYGLKKSFDFSIWEAPIDQIDNQILNPKSEYYKQIFQFTIFFESSHSLLKKYNLESKKESFSDNEFERIKNLLNILLNSTQSKIILFNYYEINDQIFGNYSSKNRMSFIYHLRRLNFLISEFCSENSRVSILDISSLQNRLGSKNMFDLIVHSL